MTTQSHNRVAYFINLNLSLTIPFFGWGRNPKQHQKVHKVTSRARVLLTICEWFKSEVEDGVVVVIGRPVYSNSMPLLFQFPHIELITLVGCRRSLGNHWHEM